MLEDQDTYWKIKDGSLSKMDDVKIKCVECFEMNIIWMMDFKWPL
jgi:hypothetical protein